TAVALNTMTRNLRAFLEEKPSLNAADIAFTLHMGRAPFAHRRILTCRDTIDALSELSSRRPEEIASGLAPGEAPQVMFLFPGGGAQHRGMGSELYLHDRSFREEADQCFEILRSLVDFDLKQALGLGEPDAHGADLNSASLAHPALFTVEYCLARLWMRWG